MSNKNSFSRCNHLIEYSHSVDTGELSNLSEQQK